MTVISAPHFCKYTAFRGLINLCSTTHSLAMSFRHFFFFFFASRRSLNVMWSVPFIFGACFLVPPKHASDVAVQYKLVSVNVLLFVVNKLFIFSHYPPVCSRKHKVLAQYFGQSAGAVFYKDRFRAYACVRTEIVALKSPFIVPRRENEESHYGMVTSLSKEYPTASMFLVKAFWSPEESNRQKMHCFRIKLLRPTTIPTKFSSSCYT